MKGHMGTGVCGKLLLLNTADGLDLRGLAVGAKLPEVFVLPAVTITLHDILVSTITRVLVAHESVEKSQRGGSRHEMLQKMAVVKLEPGLFLNY